MRIKLQTSFTTLCVIALLCGPVLTGNAQRRHHVKKTSTHSVSADEAKAAAAKKEQIRQHLVGVRKHMHDVRVKLVIAKQKEHQIN